MKWMPEHWSIRRRSRDGEKGGIGTISRALRFMDATDLKASDAWSSIFRRTQPQGFDHTCVWRDEKNQFIVTTEPYIGAAENYEKLTSWCSAHGWNIEQVTKKIGF